MGTTRTAKEIGAGMEKFEIYSMEKQITFNGHLGEAMMEAQRKSDEWNELIVLKGRKGRVIQNFMPSGYRPQ